MTTKCTDCPLRRKKLFTHMSDDDAEQMQRFKVGEMVIDAGAQILMQGSNSPQLYTALHGMGLRYKTLEDGRRQVVNFVMPGDFVGLQAAVMGEMAHSVEASSRMVLCVFDRSEFWNFVKAQPARAYDITWLSAVEEHFMGEALTAVGQRNAIERIAWAFYKVFRRGEALGLVSRSSMPFPFRQQDLADALGLSLVHTNKTIARIRERQLAIWDGGTLQVADVDALAKLAVTEHEDVPKRPFL